MANFNFNKVIIGGRVSSDVELKTTTSGLSLVQLSVAVSRKTTKDGKSETDFINCSAFGKQAEFISKFFRKGSSICVVGRLQNDKYTDKTGAERTATKIMIDEASFVDSKADNASATTAQEQTAQTANVSSAGYIPEAYTQANAPKFEDIPDNDDDLPF